MPPYHGLREREREVLKRVASGLTSREVGGRLVSSREARLKLDLVACVERLTGEHIHGHSAVEGGTPPAG